MSGWMVILDMDCVLYLHLTLNLPGNEVRTLSKSLFKCIQFWSICVVGCIY